jgi:bifunctional UDP-N-acetylglucosamine pyrophosphorylase/glucosamine-1-phosphate N-acetyltransferase
MSDALSVIVLAAGQGTRMKSDLPKVLHAIGGKPMLARVLDVAQVLKPAISAVVYGHGGEQVPRALDGYNVQWVLQAQQLGTGHAVAQALPQIPDDHTVLLLYGDVPLVTAPTLTALVQQARDGALALLTAQLSDPTGYGRIVRDGANRVQRIVEQKDATAQELAIREINTGMLAVNAQQLRGWIARLKNNNAQGEYYLTDIVGFAVADGVRVNTAQAADLMEIEGINNKAQLARLERALQLRQANEYLLQGLTLRDPARFDVRGELSFGKDVVIDVNVVIEGRVQLGHRVAIGPNVYLKDVSIGDDSEVHANSVIEHAVIGRACGIGPFARLRPDTVLADDVRVGNFVEVKKSSIAQGSKVNHLSYVGDTTMGANVNIGAGTITCNYDGANKHQTIIGNDVFIGSDTQLVAPVTIGDGATIGAGSTITRDAPAHTLSLSRAKQTTKEGWKRPVKKGSE